MPGGTVINDTHAGKTEFGLGWKKGSLDFKFTYGYSARIGITRQSAAGPGFNELKGTLHLVHEKALNLKVSPGAGKGEVPIGKMQGTYSHGSFSVDIYKIQSKRALIYFPIELLLPLHPEPK